MKRFLLLCCFTINLCAAPTKTPTLSEERLRNLAHELRLNKYRKERAVAAAIATLFTVATVGLLMHRQETSDGNEQSSTILPILVTGAAAGCGLYYLEKYTNLEQVLAQGLINVALKS
jgi:hypothetical protein